VTWQAEFIDPDTGRKKGLSLTRMGLTTRETRREWAIRKSEALRVRRAEISLGAPRKTRTNLAEAIDEFIERRTPELSESTVDSYRDCLRVLAEWAEKQRIAIVEDLTPTALTAFRAVVIARPKRRAAADAPRGKKLLQSVRRSPSTINRDLRTIRVVLNDWRRLGLTPTLDSDAIRDNLATLRVPRPIPTYLRAPQLRRLIDAALRHDIETFKITRREHDGVGIVGNTPRYRPIAPFLVTTLLTGARFSEVAGLRWNEVYLDSNEILLDADRTKTGHGRRVDLSPTPRLKAVLSRLRLQAAGRTFVFGDDRPFPRTFADSTRKRLIDQFDAPKFTWQELRRTCGSFLTCSPSIYGAASAFLSAKRLGHSVAIAERHYVGAITDISHTATTLEEAMRIDDLVSRVATGGRIAELGKETRQAQ